MFITRFALAQAQAMSRMTPLSILEELACHNSVIVRVNVLENPNTPKQLKDAIDAIHCLRWWCWIPKPDFVVR